MPDLDFEHACMCVQSETQALRVRTEAAEGQVRSLEEDLVAKSGRLTTQAAQRQEAEGVRVDLATAQQQLQALQTNFQVCVLVEPLSFFRLGRCSHARSVPVQCVFAFDVAAQQVLGLAWAALHVFPAATGLSVRF